MESLRSKPGESLFDRPGAIKLARREAALLKGFSFLDTCEM
jgi:hypothetical protein